MLLIPVIDVQNGLVVHGRFGNRAEYRPIQSTLCHGADPLTVARAFRTHFDLTELYLADLDAIVRRTPNFDLYQKLADDGFKLWVDAGARSQDDWTSESLLQFIHRLVVGSETIESNDDLTGILQSWGADRVVFSLDLRDGVPITNCPDWEGMNAPSLISSVSATGVRRVLLLDLARVGSGQGIGTERLIIESRQIEPDLQIYVGGGVSGADGLRQIRAFGVSGVLIASALHDGRLTRNDIYLHHAFE